MKKFLKKIVTAALTCSILLSSLCTNASAYMSLEISQLENNISGELGDYKYFFYDNDGIDSSRYSLKEDDGALSLTWNSEKYVYLDVYKDFDCSHSWADYGEINLSYDLNMSLDNSKNKYYCLMGELFYPENRYSRVEFYISDAWGSNPVTDMFSRKISYLDTATIDDIDYDIYYNVSILSGVTAVEMTCQFFSIRKENLADKVDDSHYSGTVNVSKHLEIYEQLLKKEFPSRLYFDKNVFLNYVSLSLNESPKASSDVKINSFSVSTEYDPEKDDKNNNDETINGDINSDGVLNALDLTMLQEYLLNIPDVSIPDIDAADFNKDGTVNILDLCLMKSGLFDTQTVSSSPVLMIDGFTYSLGDNDTKKFKNVITEDGTGHFIESDDSVGEIEEVINNGEEHIHYMASNEILNLINKIAENTDSYKYCSMRSFEKKYGDDEVPLCSGQTNVTLLYTDSSGNLQQLKLFSFGVENEILNHQDVMDLAEMLKEGNYLHNVPTTSFKVLNPVKVDIIETGGYAGFNNLYSIYENDDEYKLSFTSNGFTDIKNITEQEYKTFMSLDYSSFPNKKPGFYSFFGNSDAIYYLYTVTDESGNALTSSFGSDSDNTIYNDLSTNLSKLKNTYKLH